MELKGFICNLGKYNEGELVGKWVSFPIAEDDFNEALKSIGIGSVDCFGCPYEEWFFADWDCEIDLKFGEYERFNKVNEIAEALDEIEEDDLSIVSALVDDGYTIDDALSIVSDGDYSVYEGSSMADVAEEYVEDTGLLKGVPESISRYFDYESYGRDLYLEGNFIRVEGTEKNNYSYGYIEVLR